jgi:hypothetical protein
LIITNDRQLKENHLHFLSVCIVMLLLLLLSTHVLCIMIEWIYNDI